MFTEKLPELAKLADEGDPDYANYSIALNFASKHANLLNCCSVPNQMWGSTLLLQTNKSLAGLNLDALPQSGQEEFVHSWLTKQSIQPGNLIACRKHPNVCKDTVVEDIPLQQTMRSSGLPLTLQVQHDKDRTSVSVRKPMGQGAKEPLHLSEKPIKVNAWVPLSSGFDLLLLDDGTLINNKR